MPTLFSILGVALSLASTSYCFQLHMTVGGDLQTQRKQRVAGSSAANPAASTTHQGPPPAMDSIRTTHTLSNNINGASYPENSPFHCALYDELGRPWTKESARPTLEGRSWHATLQLPLARQMLMDAARAQSVSRDLLLDSAHLVEYVSLFGTGQEGDEEGKEGGVDVDGVWRLQFNAGAAFLKARQDKWGYLMHDEVEEGRGKGEEEAPVCLRIDSEASTIVLDALQGPAPKSFQGTFRKDDKNTMHVDFSRVQLLRKLSQWEEEDECEEEDEKEVGREGSPMLASVDLPLVNAFLRPGASMHVIAADENHLALRYLGADAPESSLLVFSKVAVAACGGEGKEEVEEEQETKMDKIVWGARPRAAKKTAVAAGAAATTPREKSSPKKDIWGHVAKATREEQPRYANANERKAERSRRVKMLGGYDSISDYFEQEGVSLFLVLVFPAFVKVAPRLIALAQVKLLLLQELMSRMGDMWH